MKRRYELTVIFSSQLSSKQLTEAEKATEDLIAKVGGKVVKKDDWGIRQFTYAINKETEGAYRFFIVELATDAGVKLEREFKLESRILRYLLIRDENK